MAEQKESSVLFSLKELMNLEEDRIRQEEDDKQKKADAEQQARLDAERRALEAEQSRLRAEDEVRRAEELRAREEAARLEAMRMATVETARVAAEQQARLQAQKEAQDHEQKITAIKESQGKKKITYIAIGVGAIALIGLIGGGFALKSQADKQALADLQHKAEQADLQAKLDKLEAQAKADEEERKKLSDDLVNMTGEAKKAAEARLAALDEQKKKNQSAIQGIRGAGGGGAVAAPVPHKVVCRSGGKVVPSCQAGDPLCSCL